MHCRGDSVGGLKDGGGSFLFADCGKVFRKTKGMEMQELNPADGKGNIPQGEFEQRTGGCHMQFGHFFVKIAEGGNGPRAGLDLIEDQECVARVQFLSEKDLEIGADSFRAEIALKNSVKCWIAFEINESHRIKMALAERLERIGFADLSGPSEEERFPTFTLFPLDEIALYETFHGLPFESLI